MELVVVKQKKGLLLKLNPLIKLQYMQIQKKWRAAVPFGKKMKRQQQQK